MEAVAAEREAAELAEIYAFFSSILEEITGEPLFEVPEAPELPARVSLLRRAVTVLDLAISPSMLRNALRTPELKPAAEALLRHFVRKSRLREPERDKTDYAVTFLYRNWEPAVAHDEMSDDTLRVFEREIAKLWEATVPPLLQEHEHLLREFEQFRAEVYGFRHFDEITDSGIVQRVRAMKGVFRRRVLSSTRARCRCGLQRIFRRAFRQIVPESCGRDPAVRSNHAA